MFVFACKIAAATFGAIMGATAAVGLIVLVTEAIVN